jgi:hypothetical protein
MHVPMYRISYPRIACSLPAIGSASRTHLLRAAVVRGIPLAPACIRPALEQLLADPCYTTTATTADLLHTCSPEPLIAFPPYFHLLYTALSSLHASPPARRPETMRRCLSELGEYGEEPLLMLLPWYARMLQNPESVAGALDVFDVMAYHLGRHATIVYLLPLLCSTIQVGTGSISIQGNASSYVMFMLTSIFCILTFPRIQRTR